MLASLAKRRSNDLLFMNRARLHDNHCLQELSIAYCLRMMYSSLDFREEGTKIKIGSIYYGSTAVLLPYSGVHRFDRSSVIVVTELNGIVSPRHRRSIVHISWLAVNMRSTKQYLSCIHPTIPRTGKKK